MKLTDRTKGILAGVLCFMLVIVGAAAFSCFFVGVVCTLDSVFSGADMTTWETDPYIMDVDIGIIAVYLCGLYYLLSLPLILIRFPRDIRLPKWVSYSLYPAHLVLLIILKLFIFGWTV